MRRKAWLIAITIVVFCFVGYSASAQEGSVTGTFEVATPTPPVNPSSGGPALPIPTPAPTPAPYAPEPFVTELIVVNGEVIRTTVLMSEDGSAWLTIPAGTIITDSQGRRYTGSISIGQ